MLEAADLECERGGKVLFRGLSFRLQPGEALRVAGANGSGKTSLLRIVCGLLPPTHGQVRWQGAAIDGLREEYSRHVVYIGHAAAVKDELTAQENLAFACRLAGQRVSEAEAAQALAAFGLSGNAAPVKRLSQGQRRRAALARLRVSASRPLWLLDEPFTALDRDGTEVLRSLMEQHLSRGGAIALATHQEGGIAAGQVIKLD